MKSHVYLIVLLLIVPVQAALFNPISLAGIKPDLSLALIYIFGLLTGPMEGMLAGVGLGLVLDIACAGLFGVNGIMRGLLGLTAGLLGKRVLDLASPSNVIFLGAFSLVESVAIAMYMEIFSGAVPVFGMVLTRMLPQALYTGFLGTIMLRYISRKSVRSALMRRSFLKE